MLRGPGSAITQFYNSAGDLLAQYTLGTEVEALPTFEPHFVGYIAPSPDPSDWVYRVEFRGVTGELKGTPDIPFTGYTDDLFFGGGSSPASSSPPGMSHR